jgi:hypothetical protein
MYVVSGCPRSGTSLMMDILRSVFGEERILGKKFPQEEHIEEIESQGEDESNEHYEARMYLYDRNSDKEQLMKDLEESKDMNPNGFWEMLYTVQGIQYRLGDVERLKKLLTEEKKSICKIVSQGLANSDPKYIDKMIYMIRHPRQVAKSQERLKGRMPFDEYPMTEDGKELRVHSPEMYIKVTLTAARWLQTHPEVPVLFVNFDDLISKPKKTLRRIQKFLGEGDFSKADGIIQPKLKRSIPEDIESPFWENAEFVYEQFLKKDYESIIEYMKNPSLPIYVENSRLYCTRCEAPKAYHQCVMCRTHDVTRNNMIKQATEKGIDWETEPCLFECFGRDSDSKALTIQESIENNFWIDGNIIYRKSRNEVEEVPPTEHIEIDLKIEKKEEPKEVEEIIFNPEIRNLVIENIDSFKSEYPDISKEDWEGYINDKGCRNCKMKIFQIFKDDNEKFNSIISRIKGNPVEISFPGPIQDPMVKEFSSIIEMEEFLKELKRKRVRYQNIATSPDGKGGYILIVT